jgi:leader peptidase (prepilin peptidase)/N-methyltransferase
MDGALLEPLLAALVAALVTGFAGAFVPDLVARLPEPEEPADDKVTYVDLAARPGLAWRTALASGVAGGLVGLAVGPGTALLPLLYLCPVGVALAYVDWRVRLLPTRVIAPSYLVVAVLVMLVGAVEGDLGLLLRAALAWLGAGVFFWLLWRFTPGMGYGDVRLAGLLGMALGVLGWTEVVVGLYAGFVVGVAAWVPMRLLRITKDRHFPFGPYMLVGAVVGVLWGAFVGAWTPGA